MSTLFGSSQVSMAVQAILAALDNGEPVDDAVERQVVDLKEEHGRRDRSGAVGPSQPHNEQAAKDLTAAAACMANTPGGGALIVGVSNAGELVGTSLDVEWLRHRIWELSGRALTVDIEAHACRGHRLLVVVSPRAIEPIRVNGRVKWRVGDHCVEVDPHTWHAKRMSVLDYDWSREESTVRTDQARPAALQHARDFLEASGEQHSVDLARQSDIDLLRRLNVVSPGGCLTNAGVIAFVGRGDPCLDYIRRQHPGGDSLVRVRRRERALLEELGEVFTALESSTPLIHVQHGLVIGQQREIPLRAAREAIVNGIAHREWAVQDPTVVEHVGSSLRVTSPGSFVGGVSPENIITHPSRSRNRSLAELLAALRIAEREGIGVDRMVGDMVRRGNPQPEIVEISGPSVRTLLTSDDVDQPWIAWLARLDPSDEADNLNSLLILRQLVDRGWTDALRAAHLIQDTAAAAAGALRRLARVRIENAPLIDSLAGVPESAEPAWVLTVAAKGALHELDEQLGHRRRTPSRDALGRDYVTARGRISSAELGGLVGADPTNMGAALRRLEDEGIVKPAWPSRRGRGFHYVRA
ncbi:ATP-binding protein [Isoptericola croceus]|uniref:ATP-binding protein n=1 Tax=Isoptericola croceus TaxID=3031406 RepID=UPI0023F7B48E|nr:ATP-binding protein [Isoptericola croceus]